MKKPVHLTLAPAESRSISAPISRLQQAQEALSDDDGIENDENDPSLSPSPVTIPRASPRRPALEKRPLSDLPTPVEPDSDSDDASTGLSPSEKNIAANAPSLPSAAATSSTYADPAREQVFKLTERRRSVNFASPRPREYGNVPFVQPFEDAEEKDDGGERPKKRVCSAEGKENCGENVADAPATAIEAPKSAVILGAGTVPQPSVSGVNGARKVSTAAKAKGRVGLRRL